MKIQPSVELALDYFLSTILGVGAPSYMLARKDRHGNLAIHESFDAIDDLISRIEQLEANGIESWFAVATYRNKHNAQVEDGSGTYGRRGSNVDSLCAFFLDIDVSPENPKKGYATLEEAHDALDEFSQKSGIPFHVVVNSGGGIHAYCLLQEGLNFDEWQRIAIRFKDAVKVAGLRADPSRTADATSLLRPVKTTNRKEKYGKNGRAVIGWQTKYDSINAGDFEAACGRLLEGSIDHLTGERPQGQVSTGIRPTNTAPDWYVALSNEDKKKVLRSMLAKLPVEHVNGHENWLRVGASLACEGNLPKDELFDVFSEWSQSTPEGTDSWNSESIEHHRIRFGSFDKSGIGSLIRRAKDAGWLPQMAVATGVDTSEIEKLYDASGGRWTMNQARAYMDSHVIFVRAENMYLLDDLLLSKEALDTSLARHMPVEDGKRISPSGMVKAGAGKIVDFIGYMPGASRIYLDGRGKYNANIYRGNNLTPDKPSPEDAETFVNFILHLSNGDEEAKSGIRSVLVKLAWLHANPAGRIPHATLLIGKVEGCGKSTLTQAIPRALFGSGNVRIVEERELSSDFNGYAENARVLCFEEIRLANRKDAEALANSLKLLITNDTVPVVKKGKDGRSVVNVSTIFASSNYDDAALLGIYDRRYHVISTDAAKLPEELAGRIHDMIRNRPGALLWLVLRYGKNGEGFDPNSAPPMTQAKKSMQEAYRAPWADRLHDAYETREGLFSADAVSLEDIKRWLGSDYHPMPSDKAIRDEVMKLAFGAKPMQAQKRTGGGRKTIRLIVIHNAKKWEQAGPAALYEHYEQMKSAGR